MIQSISIKNVAKKEKTIEVDWSDGKKSNFHFLWLRDNCPSDIDPTARERLFNLINVNAIQDNQTRIEWEEYLQEDL